MSIERVKSYFEKYHMEGRIQEFEVSSATVELAAEALHCEPQRIAKTLSFMVDGHAVLVVAAGDAKVDNHKYKEQFGTKAKMLAPDEVEALVGHAVGGVCPFAVNEGVAVFLDVSLKRFETVFPACGSANSAIELTIPELEQYSGYRQWVDVCAVEHAEETLNGKHLAAEDDSKEEMLCRYIQQEYGYAEKRARDMVNQMLPYQDIFEEFYNYACDGKFCKKDESQVEICGYTAEVLNRDFNLSPLGAYNYLVYLKEEPENAIADLKAELSRK